MKKVSKNYEKQNGRFFLLAVFILLFVTGSFAQCFKDRRTCPPPSNFESDQNINGTSGWEMCYGSAINPDPTVGDLTDMAKIVPNATSCTFSAESFPTKISSTNPVTMTFGNIKLWYVDGHGNCKPLEAQSYFANNSTNLPTFPKATYGITFTDGNCTADNSGGATITGTPTVALAFVFVSFTITAQQGSTTINRSYFFQNTSTASLWGDPHIITPDGVAIDFQQAGEFIGLRGDGGDNFEIQTRHTPVATNGPGEASTNTTGLKTCVSLITAVATRVGTHRVTWEPNINGNPDPSGMQLRVDGALTTLNDNGMDLGSGSRISRILKSTSGGDSAIEIDFPDGASLVASSNWWNDYQVWYLNLNVYHNIATKGIMGVLPYLNPQGQPSAGKTFVGINNRAKSWLPALPDGSSVGSIPDGLPDRFDTLYKRFAEAWRVTDTTSLFDYKTGMNTDSFTNKNWPTYGALSCSVQGHTPLPPIGLLVAQQLCAGISDSIMKADAIFDVMVTGEPGFAKAYLLTQQLKNGGTATRVTASKDTTKHGEPVTFTATVYRNFSTSAEALAGSVEFTVDGDKVGQSALDANGKAVLTTTSLKSGTHKIVATFTPDSGTTAFPSSSFNNITLTVISVPIWHQWWFWLILIIILLIIILALRKKNP